MGMLLSFEIRCKSILKYILKSIGFQLIRLQSGQNGKSIDDDIKKMISSESPIVIDVGSNEGQSLKEFRELLPNSNIHCFEPSKKVFRVLQESAKDLTNVTLNNCAVGEFPDTLEFMEYDESVMNSFYKPDVQNWSKPAGSYPVNVVNIDGYCNDAGLERIDLLKVDTQGHDLKVILGAKKLIESGLVRLIMCEIIFVKLYEDQPSPYSFLEILSQNGYKLVSFYNICHYHGELGWCDVLFAHESALSDA